jgi:hypothetical protein
MVGILVCGDNHFIVRGPLPDREAALALARHWSIIQIGRATPESLQPWRISAKEFREDLQWAVVVPGRRCYDRSRGAATAGALRPGHRHSRLGDRCLVKASF